MPFSNAVFQCRFPMLYSNGVFQCLNGLRKKCWTELENEVKNGLGKCVAKWHQQIEYKTGAK
jgi:hypothetical protein